MKKKVVVIGGANGTSAVILALKENLDLFDISAVVSMSDSGGSSGRLREEMGVLPPGDIMRVILALSKYDCALLRRIFYKNRFAGVGKLDGNNVGNLFMVFAEKYAGDYMSAARALEQAVEAVGHAHPVTLDKNDLCVELTNGDVIKGEGNIDRPEYDRSLKITKAWLEPAVRIHPAADKAIREADYIIIPPGSLYTSVIAALLPAGVKEAIAAARAKLICVSHGVTSNRSETGPESYSGMVEHLSRYLPRRPDIVLYSNHDCVGARAEFYQERGWKLLERDFDKTPDVNLILADLERDNYDELFSMSAMKLGKKLKEILI